MDSGNEDTHLLPDTDNAIRTRTKSKKSVHYSICVILILHNVSTQSGYSVIMEYTFRHISEQIQADLTNSSITQSIPNKNCSFHSAEAQRESAQWDAYYGYAEYIPGLFVVVFGGIMSDYYGRRFFIILPLLGTFLQYFATLVVVQYNLDIKYFFVGFLLAGITGTRCTLSMALSGVVADITKYDKSRSFTFALLHLYYGIGSTIAHISTGYTLKYLGSVPPCLVSLVLCFFNLFTGLYLPETLGNSKRKTNDDTLCQKVGRFFAFYTSSSNLRDGQVWQFVMCVLALTFVISPFTTRSSVDVLYFLGQPFCFTSEKIGWYDSTDDVVSLCISVFVLKLFHFCANDDTIAILSCLSGILSFTIEGFASVWWMLYVAAICGVISLNALPVIRGILSRLVNETRQGALFANIYFLETMFRLIGDLVFFNVYADTQGFMKGFVYFVYAAFIAAGGSFMIPVLISARRKFRKMQEMTIQV